MKNRRIQITVPRINIYENEKYSNLHKSRPKLIFLILKITFNVPFHDVEFAKFTFEVTCTIHLDVAWHEKILEFF